MFPKNVFTFFLTFLLSVIPGTPFIYLMMHDPKNQSIYLTINFIIVLLTFIGLVHFINHKKKIPIHYNFKPFDIKFLLFGILIVWFIRLFMTAINISIIPKQLFNPDIYTILGALTLAPILEEIIFRNILLNSLLNSYGRNKAIIISSVAFALIHLQPLQMLNALIIGLFLGIVYAKTKNIGYTMILHFFANFFSFLMQYIIAKFYHHHYFIITFCITIAVSVLLSYYMYKKHGYSMSDPI
jgi:uncharacterized protein